MEFKFKPGTDIVEHVVSARQVAETDRNIYLMSGQDGRARYFVVEAEVRQCYVGMQVRYLCRGVFPSGRADGELRTFYEPELVLSRPFRDDPQESVSTVRDE